MSEPRQRRAPVLVLSMASVFALGATVPKVAIQSDPTRPPSFTGGTGDAPTLSGGGQGAPTSANRLTTTVVAPGASFAVIDGQRVEEGDFVAGARVVKIDPARVTLRGISGPYELRFYALPVKVEPGSLPELAASFGPSIKADSDLLAEPTAEAQLDTGAEPGGGVEPGVELESAIQLEDGAETAPDTGESSAPGELSAQGESDLDVDHDAVAEPGLETEQGTEVESGIEALPASNAAVRALDE